MPKISVIVPVYNNEKYIGKCIESILKQKMQDFEIIIVNDGSTDDSEKVINKYLTLYMEKIKYYKKENGGISSTRNFGINKATGDYICFVDSDDYISDDLFEKLDKYIHKQIDIIKYKCIKVDENFKEIERIDGPVFKCCNGQDAFDKLFSNDVLIDTVWLCLYRREFFLNNNLFFPEGKYHEDWAIVPYSIVCAESIISTDIFGYYYVQSYDSITRNNKDEKIFKRACDMLEHYDNLVKKINNDSIRKSTQDNFKIYMSNCLILKLEELPEKYHKQYIEELKKRKIVDNFKVKSIKQFIKKVLLRLNIKLYLKIR